MGMCRGGALPGDRISSSSSSSVCVCVLYACLCLCLCVYIVCNMCVCGYAGYFEYRHIG